MPKVIGDLRLYDLKELSKLSGVHVDSLKSYIRSGRLKGRKFGREWYVSERALQEYFDNPPDHQKKRDLPVRQKTGRSKIDENNEI